MLRHLLTTVRHRSTTILPHHNHYHRSANYKHPKTSTPPSPPKPPKAPQKPQTFTFHYVTWEDPYSWMSSLQDKVAMRHMDMYMEQEEKYTEAVMSETERLQTKLQSEMASRLNFDLSTPPVRWGPWLYYIRVEEGKQYPVLCRRLASLKEEFISHKSPGAGFVFTSGKRIEHKLLDYNQEAERFPSIQSVMKGCGRKRLCTDVDLVKRRLQDMRMKYVTDVDEDEENRVDQVFFHDPDGYMIELCNCENILIILLSSCSFNQLNVDSWKMP